MPHIRQLMFNDGERYPILLDDNGIPDFWITLYIIEKLRFTHTQSTITNALAHLIHLKLWEYIHNRNLIEELTSYHFLSDNDIDSIRHHCFLDSKTLKNELFKRKLNNSFSPSMSTIKIPPTKTVSKNHAANRIFQIAEFLYFVSRIILKNSLHNNILVQKIEMMRQRLLANKPKNISRNSLVDKRYLHNDESLASIMKLIQEDNPDNPFKDSDIKLRNALIFEIMYFTGMRAGEILALQCRDIDFYMNYISITRRHDSLEDLRKYQPVAKTQERNIPISIDIAERLHYYILNCRSKIPYAKRHPYIFVTHKKGIYHGKPISNSTFINRILKPVLAINPELFSSITRHSFRHNFNYLLSKRIDAINKKAKNNGKLSPITEKHEIQIRKHLNGWISDGTAETYNLRHIKEEANNLMLNDIEYWSKLLKKE